LRCSRTAAPCSAKTCTPTRFTRSTNAGKPGIGSSIRAGKNTENPLSGPIVNQMTGRRIQRPAHFWSQPFGEFAQIAPNHRWRTLGVHAEPHLQVLRDRRRPPLLG